MVTQISPAVSIVEIDLSGVVTGVQSSTGAMAGNFLWGPIDEPRLIDNEGTMAATYGTPLDDPGKNIGPAVDYFSATQFLSYSRRLYVNRVLNTGSAGIYGARTAQMDGGVQNFIVKNKNDYERLATAWVSGTPTSNPGPFLAKYASTLGNSLGVSVFCPVGANPAAVQANFNTWTHRSLFTGPPGTSPWLSGLSDSANQLKNDEVHIVVIDAQGRFTGTKGAVLETFAYVSVAPGAKTIDGGSNYLPEVLVDGSRYIYFGIKPNGANKYFGTEAFVAPVLGQSKNYSTGCNGTYGLTDVIPNTGYMSTGKDNDTVNWTGTEMAADYNRAFALFNDVDTLTVDLLIAPSMKAQVDQVAVVQELSRIAGTLRKDCVVVASPHRDAVVTGYGTIASDTAVTNVVAFANAVAASSYLILDNNFVKVLDKYNDRYIWIPAASTTAGIMAATDLAEGPWLSPAGQKRGQYYGIVDIAYNPSKAARDQLYSAGVNPVVNLPGRGTILYGDKTKEFRASAFDRINVRRLFLNIERAIARAAVGVMFEFNDEFTRAEFVNIVEPYLREIQGRRGITAYAVQCDASNNPPSVVDRNELVASVFIKPARSINYVTLNFVAVRSGVLFEEIIGTV